MTRTTLFFLFFKGPATTEIYTLSLHDALPIFVGPLAHRRLLANVRWRAYSAAPTGRRCRVTADSSTPSTGKRDRKSTRLNSSHPSISYAVFCLKKKNEHM